MLDKLYQKENNLFQSAEWAKFQESLGRKVITFKKNDCLGTEIGLPFNKKYIWIQKSPKKIDIAEIKEVAKKEKAIFVRVEPPKEPNQGKRVREKSLLSGQKSPEATRILDVTNTEEEILAKMKPKTRYNIRLAEKKGVKVKISKDLADIETFYTLLEETASKNKGYSPFPKDYYQKMFTELSKTDLLWLVLGGIEGKTICGLLISVYGEVATYLHGGSSEKNKNVMAPYLCQWHAIKEAKRRGCKLYDFWGIAKTENPNDPWAGITKFKSGFGGETIIFPGSYDFVNNKFWYNILTLAAKARKEVSRLCSR